MLVEEVVGKWHEGRGRLGENRERDRESKLIILLLFIVKYPSIGSYV